MLLCKHLGETILDIKKCLRLTRSLVHDWSHDSVQTSFQQAREEPRRQRLFRGNQVFVNFAGENMTRMRAEFRTDWANLKTELSRLTDVKYLKKELNRVANEVKTFDVQKHLTPQARQRLEKFESRFHEALKTLQDLQKQVDDNLDRWVSMIRTSGFKHSAKATTKRASTKKKTTRKATAKSAAKSSAKTTKKAAR